MAEKTLAHAFKVVSGRAFLRVSPIVIMHWTGKLDGGLADMERRVLRELADSVGARRSHVWEGRELTSEDIRQGFYGAT